jgi:nucleotide-binding universal stress UspA family protein
MLKKILVPLDGSETAEAILPLVQALAAPLNAEVTLLRVQSGAGTLSHVTERETYEASAYLKVHALAFHEQGITAHHVIRTGNAAAEIVDYATVNKMDLIAMSTHGRSGLSRAVMGSVAEHVVRHTTAPVLLVKASQRGSS